MAVLTKKEILEKIKEGSIAFSPGIDRFQIQAHSVDLRIGFTFIVPKSAILSPEGRQALKVDYGENRRYFDVVELEAGQYFEILPGEFIGISTLERVKVPQDVMGVLYPRSSINRRGLSVDLSGIIDAGFEGNLLVPVRNNTTSQVIRIYPGERFCQIVFEDLAGKVAARESRYHKKDAVVGVLKEMNAAEERCIRKGKIKELKAKFPLV
jgi:dCTP deaminase